VEGFLGFGEFESLLEIKVFLKGWGIYCGIHTFWHTRKSNLGDCEWLPSSCISAKFGCERSLYIYRRHKLITSYSPPKKAVSKASESATMPSGFLLSKQTKVGSKLGLPIDDHNERDELE